MSLSPTRRAKAAAIAGTAYPVVAVLGRTLRWRQEGTGHYDDLMRQGRPPILAFWHGRILPAMLYWRDRGIVVMTSENFDGEWITRLMARFGHLPARGSTSHGGARALVQLRRDLSMGRAVAFTVDGPRGPARVAQRGAVWLAGATGNPVLPFHIEASRAWTASSWDASIVPRPFATVAVAVGDPLEVQGTDDGVVKEQTSELERRLRALEERCRALLRPE